MGTAEVERNIEKCRRAMSRVGVTSAEFVESVQHFSRCIDAAGRSALRAHIEVSQIMGTHRSGARKG